jgi:hypothetical protein
MGNCRVTDMATRIAAIILLRRQHRIAAASEAVAVVRLAAPQLNIESKGAIRQQLVIRLLLLRQEASPRKDRSGCSRLRKSIDVISHGKWFQNVNLATQLADFSAIDNLELKSQTRYAFLLARTQDSPRVS